jgi:fructan beta-fructosidase
LLGDELLLRLAGGDEPALLHVDLWVDGNRVFSSSGRNGDGMSRRSWDIRPYRGRKAELEIVDGSVDDWGYIAVDEILQWSAR